MQNGSAKRRPICLCQRVERPACTQKFYRLVLKKVAGLSSTAKKNKAGQRPIDGNRNCGTLSFRQLVAANSSVRDTRGRRSSTLPGVWRIRFAQAFLVHRLFLPNSHGTSSFPPR